MKSQRINETLIVDLPPMFDINNYMELKSKINPYLSEGDVKKVVLNLRETKFIDSTGLGSIISVYRNARRNGEKLVMCNLSPQIYDLMRLTRLDEILNIKSSLEEVIDEQ